MGSQAGHLAGPLRKVGIRRRASWLWENPALPWSFQTAAGPVIIRTSPSKLGKSLVFHEIVMFLMPSDRFTSKPKNRDCFTPKAGGGKKSGVHTVTMSGKVERQEFRGSVGTLSSEPGVSMRREQAVFNVLFLRRGASRSSSHLPEDPSGSAV